MPAPVLYDAVTLLHFAVSGHFDALKERHAAMPEPRWTEAVRTEIENGARHGHPGCGELLHVQWLGEPVVPTASDRACIVHLLVALNDGAGPPVAHAGEAETIYFAEKLDTLFVTDDNAAYDFARRRLGDGRVKDTVDLLREAVAIGELTPARALAIADSIRSCERHLRRVHPSQLSAAYFDW